MSELTLTQITAAQAYDQDAVTAVLAEMDSRIASLAAKSAGTLATNPARYADYAEEFRQEAMVALLEYLPRWSGDSVDAFREYLYGAMAGELKAKVGAERNSGVDRDAFSTFKAMVAEADGDLHLAEKLAQTKPPKGKRLSADRANAARLAWQGPVSIDKMRTRRPSFTRSL
jgi:DNA-directed RNA polymerase specialized sigma24 family protein